MQSTVCTKDDESRQARQQQLTCFGKDYLHVLQLNLSKTLSFLQPSRAKERERETVGEDEYGGKTEDKLTGSFL